MKMKAPKGFRSFSVGPDTYEATDSNVIEVEQEHVVFAKEHGFVEYIPENMSLEDLINEAHELDESAPTVERVREELIQFLTHLRKRNAEENEHEIDDEDDDKDDNKNAPTPEELAAARDKNKLDFLAAVDAARSKAQLRDIAKLYNVDVSKVDDLMQELITALQAWAELPEVQFTKAEA